jgi:aspartate racemase
MEGAVMKTIGVIGGMSWESTQTYYRLINQRVNQLCGGFHSANIIVNSIDFAPIVAWQKNDEWAHAAQVLARAAQQLERAGCDYFAIATNTMHLVADTVQAAVSIPLIHIAAPTGHALQQQGLKRVALLGTRFTMEKPFYRDYLKQYFGIDCVTPSAPQRDQVHQIIYDELCAGKIHAHSRDAYKAIIHDLQTQGAQAVILGCTEIGLLISENDVAIPVIDTTLLHAQELARLSLI